MARKPAIRLSVLRIVKGARYRTQRRGRQPLHLGGRIFGDGFQVGVLPGLFPGDPVLPGLVQRLAEDMFELVGVIGLAALVAPQPRDQLFRAIGQRQIGIEARAVEIGVGADLEIDGIAFRFQAGGIEEMGVVAHHGAEHHLVIAALGAAQAAAHPGFHEDGRAFQVPARHIGAGLGQVIVKDGFGMRGDRRRLAVKDIAPEGVIVVPHIHGGQMHRLMVHQREEALAGAEGLERRWRSARCRW